MIYDDTVCALGEGPLWHPKRNEFFWFDILGKKLHRKDKSWDFPDYVSAAGWVDGSRMVVASSRALHLFDIDSGAVEHLVDLEAEMPNTRSNDGRADPQGGFWIGTMGLTDKMAGSIYRFYKGELRKLYGPVSVSNSICFTPDGGHALFSDTGDQRIMKVALDADGWPREAPELFVDLRSSELKPDGAVIDADGNLWNAQWGAGRVARYGPDGAYLDAIEFNAAQTSCPAFGGEGLHTLFCTSAATGIDDPASADHGRTFAVETEFTGQAEHRVIL